MNRLRIAVAVDFLPDQSNPHRGRANYQRVRNLAKFAEVRAYRLQPAYPSFRKLNENHAKDPIAEVLRYQAVPFVSRAMNGRAAAGVLADEVRQFRPDVILAYFVYPIGFAAVAAGRELGIPAVVGAVGSDLRRMNGIFVRPLITQAITNAAFVTTVSEELRRRAIARGAKPEHVRTIHDGCDAEIFHPGERAAARAELQVAPDAELVLFVGSMLPLKGIAELLDATAMLAAKRPNLQVVCIGEGTHQGEFRARAAAPDLAEHVRFTGGKLPEEVAQWMTAANVFCLPSHSEGMPDVILEALNSGRAVVAADVGGIPEFVTPKCGILVPPKDARRLAEALSQALDTKWDEDGIARTFRRSWEDWARETYEVCCLAAGRSSSFDRAAMSE
jgi:teichuronic acid biosynthesis glycosyltransferase TuaC